MKFKVPKSLHTVTVLVKLAGHFMETRGDNIDGAVTDALEFLGYSRVQDIYGLAAQATKQLWALDILPPDAPEEIFRCRGCGRPEDECSAEPCGDVIADRGEL
jgi:hypothetical protein